ncbi:hypothetical protein EFS30_09285 [Levilactobacillus parabrevis]|nr:hypothetical protein [Levilactobacillus parabrevis]MCT4490792.1 hypothetical protein [Levilactobacillus parabrevis]
MTGEIVMIVDGYQFVLRVRAREREALVTNRPIKGLHSLVSTQTQPNNRRLTKRYLAQVMLK